MADTTPELPSDLTNVALLLEALPSYSDKNPSTFLLILEHLVALSATKPDEFVHYPPLFHALHLIAGKDKASVETILTNLSHHQAFKPALKAKFDTFFDGTPSSLTTTFLRGLLISLGIIQIFDMRAIMASETTPVYAMAGHGCVFEKRPPIVVPKGVIWIELTVCGIVAYMSDFFKFINPETRKFLEETPIPSDEPSQQKYQTDLRTLTDYGIGVKFPGQTVADGTNSLFAEIFNYSYQENPFVKSGIFQLYSNGYSKYEEIERGGTVKNGKWVINDIPYSLIYSDSIYPTVEQALRTNPDQTNYSITFKDLFQQISLQDYDVTKPMILINASCRVPCGADYELDAPALRRQNSEEGKAKTIRELPILDLIKPGRKGQTYLMSLIKQKLFGHARLLMERIENELGLEGLRKYLSEQNILDSIYVLPSDRWDYWLKKQVPKEFKEWIIMKTRDGNIAAGGSRRTVNTRKTINTIKRKNSIRSQNSRRRKHRQRI